MGSEWKKIVLGDLLASGDALLQTGPFGTALKAEEYTETGVPLISVREIREGFIEVESKTPRVDSTVTQRLPKFVLRSGDILFARKGGVERNALITEREHGWFVGSDGIYLRLSDKYCSEYYSYVMRSPQVKKWLLKNCEGTTMPSLNQKILSRIPIFEPSLIEQRKVAKVLRAFDKKISLNNQINQTLEHMAQTLFKSWFVDFDPVIDNALDAGSSIPEVFETRVERRKAVRESTGFKPLPDDVRQLFPSEFEESELGWVPKGWETSTAGQELTVKGGSTPSTKNPDFWDGGNINWTSPKDLSDNDTKIMFETSRKITDAGLAKITSGLLPRETVLMSSRAPVGYLALTKIPVAINQGYIAIPESRRLSQEYILYWLDSQMDMIKGLSGGTTFAEISKKTFKSISILVPPCPIVEAFSKNVEVYLNKISSNVGESSLLATVQSSLLPKLISGELEIIRSGK